MKGHRSVAKLNRRKSFYLATLVLIAILYSIIQYTFPLMFDDWGFIDYWREMEGSDGFSFKGLKDYYLYIRQYNNGRLSDTFSPFSTIIYPWYKLFPLFTGCFMALILHLLCRIASWGKTTWNLFLLAICWGMALCLLPWFDFIFSAAFALNYIWATGITLSFIYLLIRRETKGWKIMPLILLSILAVVAGGWHEGFAFASIAGLVLLAICRKGKVSSQFTFILSVYAISAFIFFMAPSTLGRVGNALKDTGNYFNILIFIIDIIFIILFCLIIFICLLQKDFKNIFKDVFRNPYCIFVIGSAFAGYSLALFIHGTPRAYFWPGICMLTIILAFIYRFILKLSSKKWYDPTSRILTIIIILLCTSQSVATIYWLDKYQKENEYIISQLKANNGGTVFKNVIQPWELPYFTLKIPPQKIWVTPTNYGFVYILEEYDWMAVVPEALEYADISKGKRLEGNIGASNLNGYIVTPFRFKEIPQRGIRPDHAYVEYKDNKGHTRGLYMLEAPFITRPFLHDDGNIRADTLIYYRVEPWVIPDITSFSVIDSPLNPLGK